MNSNHYLKLLISVTCKIQWSHTFHKLTPVACECWLSLQLLRANETIFISQFASYKNAIPLISALSAIFENNGSEYQSLIFMTVHL